MAGAGNNLTIPEGYRLEQGLLWPDDDQKCAAAVFGTVPDIHHAFNHVRATQLVVQAGGNMGVWPRALSGLFSRVVTFEADPRNYRALVWNTTGYDNILAMPCALGGRQSWVSTEAPPSEEGNAGALRVGRGDTVPMIALDSLQLPACDMIYLDIEGFEFDALVGATETIIRHRPVIAFEDKGLSEHYGVKKGAAEHYLSGLKYKVVARPHRDVVMVPE